jgi:guanylate cyclase
VDTIKAAFEAALTRLSAVGADPSDDEETRLRKGLLVLLAVLILPIGALWWLLYLAFGSWTGWFAFAYVVISTTSILLFARNHDVILFLRIQLVSILVLPTISMLWLGGALDAGGVGLWGILAPLGALVFLGVRSGIRWFAAFLVLFLVGGGIGALLDITSPVPVWFSTLMVLLNIAVGGIVVFTLLAIFAQQRRDALMALQVEHERAEGLLLNILPGSIAARLKASPTTIADQFTEASVLFADVVDFTPRSQRLPPAQVVGLLDRLFSHFDELAERRGLEKIKTIGDAYMVAAGVPNPRPDHARALALVALDMTEALNPSGALGDLGLQVRIGLNSGPVVAGVIGRKRFLYDLWGDAVNTASRMESQGTPNRIQITQATYELLRDEFECEPRGTVPIKGKGEMPTWYLVGRRDSAVEPDQPGEQPVSVVAPASAGAAVR